MYDQSMGTAGRRRSVRYRAARPEWGRGAARGQERVRLLQLMICLALFFAVLLGKGVFPEKLERLRENALAMISADFNFEETLSRLGESLAGGDSVISDLGAFCVEVFGAAPEENEPEEVSFVPSRPGGAAEELRFLETRAGGAVRAAHYADFSRFGLELPESGEEQPPEDSASEEEPAVVEEEPAVPAAGTVVRVSDYSGDPLPANYTMDQLSLGELETMTPVMGRLNSIYGYRDHPVSGKYLFHGGVDIGGQKGDPIAAFASGTVEYTGKDSSYGLYLQIDHGNGVKSFYAHCSRIVVTKGQSVALGEKVAEIGSTGNSTGPHLHLELKYNKMHLNPAYYVEFLEQ